MPQPWPGAGWQSLAVGVQLGTGSRKCWGLGVGVMGVHWHPISVVGSGRGAKGLRGDIGCCANIQSPPPPKKEGPEDHPKTRRGPTQTRRRKTMELCKNEAKTVSSNFKIGGCLAYTPWNTLLLAHVGGGVDPFFFVCNQ